MELLIDRFENHSWVKQM